MPTIDPAEFSDAGLMPAGALGDDNLDDLNLHPPGSPGWQIRQEEKASRGEAQPVPQQQEDMLRSAEAKAKARHAAANARFQQEAELHKQEMAKMAALKQSELETLLGVMDEQEARSVRLQAYLRALDAGHGSQRERQLHADTLALRLARYMVEGRAE